MYIKIKVGAQTKGITVANIIGRSKLSKFLSLPEDEFQKYIREIERNPIFQRFANPDKSEDKIIRYKRFKASTYSGGIYEFNESISVDSSTPGIEDIIKKNKKIISVIKSLGINNFEKYFLYNETEMGITEISNICKLNKKKTIEIMDMVNAVFIREEFFCEDSLEYADEAVYWKIANIIQKNGHLRIEYLSLNSAKGRYVIDYKKLIEHKESGLFNSYETREINALISQLKMINSRKTLVYRVLQLILEKQGPFIKSGIKETMESFTQKDATSILGVSPGVMSRTISGKSIGLPWGAVRPLKCFFVHDKQRKKEIVLKIIEKSESGHDNRNGLSDQAIKGILLQKYGINLSRRSICQYRNELSSY